MTSWRDTASQQAQDDLDGLLEPAFGFAHEQLLAHGEFYPYAVALRSDGETTFAAAAVPGADDRPPSADVLEACRTGLAQERSGLRATAVVADVRADGHDAIRVELEHVEGTALTVLLPYDIRDGEISFGALTAGPGPGYVFG